MPTDDELNEMAHKIAGMDYHRIANPVNRLEVMRLAIAAIGAEALSDIRDSVGKFGENFHVFMDKSDTNWNNLDVELTKIGDWFKHSKVFDGIDRR